MFVSIHNILYVHIEFPVLLRFKKLFIYHVHSSYITYYVWTNKGEKGQTINYLHQKTENQYLRSTEIRVGELTSYGKICEK